MMYLDWQRKCIITTVVVLSSLLLVFSSITYASERNTEDSLKITTHNVYFLPTAIYPNWGQSQRADLISKADYIQGQDVVILNELFDHKASNRLLTNLKSQYPYQTPIVGQGTEGWQKTSGSYRKLKKVSGGVGIVSKWPIVQQEQHIYKNGCGADSVGNKGFAYIKINKNGKYQHIIGTHLQAEDPVCMKGKDQTIRQSQMEEIKQFIKDKNIPKDEPVYIGGDLNVIKGSSEYQKMSDNLNVSMPKQYEGNAYSWDTQTNGIANYNYPKLEPQHLDYILLDRDHAQPSSWHNHTHKVKSPEWSVKSWGKTYRYNDYSDHYPVSAYAAN
ncbi:sphingomyelin phosphodiesterase [Staphylococcus sp. HMSC73C01]|nr:sphingomyelin phosphodiesterase [Staphylococcus lugdunensis]OHP73113.1 sphingomyelin phosphodiesterase [Staphylococcus sp. HMSC062D12]OHP88988.1 sphingomyelin phosphodiesterase [Staphylococcus sp. HMSC063E12]OHS40151.1 sphingomyelin phosphodiesterase [Staphylococcus sp. HMSC62D11]OHS59847.1 sphingomyelin phosphodiesterase [Staphylococcus sp. HMSC69H07]OHS68991.1 sphingomyelin phosphodiesterase [Staphylococcus sp. HMSC73C01]